MRPEGFLAVDSGNTRLKAAILPLGGYDAAETASFASDDIDGLLAWIEEHPARCGAMVSVKRTDIRLAETLRQLFDGDFLLVTHHTPLPISVEYATPATLGLDRAAAACGALALFPDSDCIVVDAGTALTIDLLAKDPVTLAPVLRGGSISPGLRMRLKALHDFTELLPQVHPPYGECPERWAKDTRSALVAGALGGMADQIICSLIECTLSTLRSPLSPQSPLSTLHSPLSTKIVLTGGDAGVLADTLRARVPALMTDAVAGLVSADVISVRPDLISCGLMLIYENYILENEKNI